MVGGRFEGFEGVPISEEISCCSAAISVAALQEGEKPFFRPASATSPHSRLSITMLRALVLVFFLSLSAAAPITADVKSIVPELDNMTEALALFEARLAGNETVHAALAGAHRIDCPPAHVRSFMLIAFPLLVSSMSSVN